MSSGGRRKGFRRQRQTNPASATSDSGAIGNEFRRSRSDAQSTDRAVASFYRRAPTAEAMGHPAAQSTDRAVASFYRRAPTA
ncbi:MAG TPA: hypothetical protein PK093_18720, partial [Phycisphaerae bacterium]|nr:hypothetical protein [Phycisphaerae bacterium]